jgi:hypothetical protein
LLRIAIRMDRTRAGRKGIAYPKRRISEDYSKTRRALQEARELVDIDEPQEALATAREAVTLAKRFRDSIAGRIAEGERLWGTSQEE